MLTGCHHHQKHNHNNHHSSRNNHDDDRNHDDDEYDGDNVIKVPYICVSCAKSNCVFLLKSKEEFMDHKRNPRLP